MFCCFLCFICIVGPEYLSIIIQLPYRRGARLSRLAKSLDIAGSSLTADGLFFWYGPLASLSLQIASVASEHHGEKNGGPNQWIIGSKSFLGC